MILFYFFNTEHIVYFIIEFTQNLLIRVHIDVYFTQHITTHRRSNVSTNYNTDINYELFSVLFYRGKRRKKRRRLTYYEETVTYIGRVKGKMKEYARTIWCSGHDIFKRTKGHATRPIRLLPLLVHGSPTFEMNN